MSLLLHHALLPSLARVDAAPRYYFLWEDKLPAPHRPATDMVTTELTDRGVERLREAYAIIAGVPAARVDMTTWGVAERLHEFVGCAGGWLSWHPAFNAYDLTRAAATVDAAESDDDRQLHNFRSMAEVFDLPRDNLALAEWLFGCPPVRYIVPGGSPQHKRIFLQRVRLLLEAAGAISAGRSAELDAYEETLQ